MKPTILRKKYWQKLLDSAWLSMGYASFNQLPEGISFYGKKYPAEITFLKDLTYVDRDEIRHTRQEIFDTTFATIRQARKLILLDMFLFNDFQGIHEERTRLLSSELCDLLIKQKATYPGIEIIFITDPVNTVYGGVRSGLLESLVAAGIEVVMTDLDKLRDSNPIYSFFWRLLVRPFHISPGGLFPSPISHHYIPLRSYLKLFNFKANHRKTVIADEGDSWAGIVMTGNPHDASSAHRNIAVKFSGLAVADLFQTELAALKISAAQLPAIDVNPLPSQSDTTLQVVSEKKIKLSILKVLSRAVAGDHIDLIIFYLADQQVIKAIKSAAQRGVIVRIILDPNKDAFGRSKIGIPNRPVAHDLQGDNLSIRWAHTHGEQCHSKMLIHLNQKTCTLILGSANLTRRNLDDFNLETDVVIEGSRDCSAIKQSCELFELVWNNRANEIYSIDYERYRDPGRFRYWLYRLMEITGISTF